MTIYYHPETDSLSIKLRSGEAGVVGEIMGEDLNENVVLHRDDAGSSRNFSGSGCSPRLLADRVF